MKNNAKRNKIHRWYLSVIFAAAALIFGMGAVHRVEAGTFHAIDMDVFEGVTVSPNGQAWTTDYLDKSAERLSEGVQVHTGIPSSLPVLQQGEHYYLKPATGSVNVGRWEIAWPNAQCIHFYGAMDYMGYHLEEGFCGNYYNNGWNAYCADCGEPVTNLYIYARKSTVEKITSMPAKSVYMYICPICHGLEQGAEYQHLCKAVSANRYSVCYKSNAPMGTTVSGYMPDTRHMYDNAGIYEGKTAAEQGYGDKILRLNSYMCIGYVFTGWNTEPDGSGSSFSDGQEVCNLTAEEAGKVVLYAQWKRTESTLVIDADGGSYLGEPVFTVKGNAYTEYQLRGEALIPGSGFQVRFDTDGGSSAATIKTEKKFSHWEAQGMLYGTLAGQKYQFGIVDGAVDRVKAVYTNQSFTLPDSYKENASLVGWYREPDRNAESYVGKPGEEASVEKDTVLYAKWAVLTLWAEDDYESYQGIGAVDLSWEQKDGNQKYYKIYQSANRVDWKEIHTAESAGGSVNVSENYDAGLQGKSYIIEKNGYYTLSAFGAQGADYNSTLTGGKGGKVTASYWLQKGDRLSFYAAKAGSGLQGGGNGSSGAGGSASAATGRGGGGATVVYLTRNGVQAVLLVAGGGGGANEKSSGQHGGSALSGIGNMSGANAAYGGGGGGATGGSGGTYSVHNHVGSSVSGGGCYIARSGTKVCGTAYEVHGAYWECSCGDTWGTESHGYFSSLPEHAGHEQYFMDPYYNCSGCGKQMYDGEVHYISYTYYELGCPYKDKPNGYVISAGAANGGNSYINTGYGCKNQSYASGIQKGNGYASLQSIDIGYREETVLCDVYAPDRAAPEAIGDCILSRVTQSDIKIEWERPEDLGTPYYHLAKSFLPENGVVRHITDSNETRNILTTGVAGYYYYIDRQQSGRVTADAICISEEHMLVSMDQANQYLHIAAVDRAGNIGPTRDLLLALENLPIDDDYPLSCPLYTEKLQLEESEFVYSPDGVQYYVKADGITSHSISGAGYLAGAATKEYQVDSLRFLAEGESGADWFQITVPHGSISESSTVYDGSCLTWNVRDMVPVYLQPVWTTAERKEQAGYLQLIHGFTVSDEGQPFYIYPQAVATLRGKEYTSEESADRSNGLTVIPDAEPPRINGMDALETFEILDMTEETLQFTVNAADSGSGLAFAKVIVSNLDNFLEREFDADISEDGTGSITVTVNKFDPLFLGEISISAVASDRVGNVYQMGEKGIAFTLEAEVFRQRNPEEKLYFKAGDGACLAVTTSGYADRVEISFPAVFMELQPDLNRVYEYPYPYLNKTERILFSIPLEMTENSCEITVTAWKNGQKLTEKPMILVVEGSVLDELRTRIRNNGR